MKFHDVSLTGVFVLVKWVLMQPQPTLSGYSERRRSLVVWAVVSPYRCEEVLELSLSILGVSSRLQTPKSSVQERQILFILPTQTTSSCLFLVKQIFCWVPCPSLWGETRSGKKNYWKRTEWEKPKEIYSIMHGAEEVLGNYYPALLTAQELGSA